MVNVLLIVCCLLDIARSVSKLCLPFPWRQTINTINKELCQALKYFGVLAQQLQEKLYTTRPIEPLKHTALIDHQEKEGRQNRQNVRLILEWKFLN